MKTSATSPAREVFWQAKELMSQQSYTEMLKSVAFIKARKHLEEIVATEGNTELQSFLTTGSVDWKTELERNRQLTSRTELQTKESGSHQSLYTVNVFANKVSWLSAGIGIALASCVTARCPGDKKGDKWNQSCRFRSRCLEKASLDYG
ncbi:unnamed protein product [Boreogadus saida]